MTVRTNLRPIWSLTRTRYVVGTHWMLLGGRPHLNRTPVGLSHGFGRRERLARPLATSPPRDMTFQISVLVPKSFKSSKWFRSGPKMDTLVLSSTSTGAKAQFSVWVINLELRNHTSRCQGASDTFRKPPASVRHASGLISRIREAGATGEAPRNVPTA